METKFNTNHGPFIHFENQAHCPRCANIIPPNQLACLGCVPEGKKQRVKAKRSKPQPDQDGLLGAVPGVRV
jgi:hypothetical protein